VLLNKEADRRPSVFTYWICLLMVTWNVEQLAIRNFWQE